MAGAVAGEVGGSRAAGVHNGHVLGIAALVVPTLGLYAGLGVAPLLVLTAVVAAVVQWRRSGTWPLPRGPIAVIFAGVIVLGGVSFAWSIDPNLKSADRLARLALMFFCGLTVVNAAQRLEATERTVFGRLAIAGMLLALSVLAIERFGGAPIRSQWPVPSNTWNSLLDTFSRGMAVLALLIWPACATLWQRSRAAAAMLWLAALVLLSFMQSGAALGALVVGPVAALGVWLWSRKAIRVLATCLALIVLALPVASHHIPSAQEVALGELAIPNSAHHRLLIWRFTSDRIAERPLLGWGFDQSRAIPGAGTLLGEAAPALPLHPHSLPMQWWLELGVPGALLGMMMVGWVALSLSRLEHVTACAGAGALVAGSWIAMLSYGAWQNWWIALLFLTAALCQAVPQNTDPDG